MTFQAAPVDRSVKRMCSSGHIVVFDDHDGSEQDDWRSELGERRQWELHHGLKCDAE